MLSDLSFADLVLWVRDRDGGMGRAWRTAGRAPGPTVYYDDVVGTRDPAGTTGRPRPGLRAAPDLPGGATRSGTTTSRCGVRPSRWCGTGRVARRDVPQHQPRRRPDAESARADLPAVRGRPGPDGVRRRLPGRRGSDRAAPRCPPGGRRSRSGSTSRAGSGTRARTRCPPCTGSATSGTWCRDARPRS